MTQEFFVLIFGVAIGWLASHSTRKARLLVSNPTRSRNAASDKRETYIFLSAFLDDYLLKDVYILVDNLYAFIKRHHNARFVMHILFFITGSGMTIESGINQLKDRYPHLFMPSADTVLRTLHSMPPEDIEKAILSTIRQIFNILKRYRGKKDIRTVTKHVWLAIDITDIPYYGKMGSQKQEYSYKRASEFVARSQAFIHNTKDGKALKYLTASIAAGPLSGLLVYVAPLKVGYSTSVEVDKALSFLSCLMHIELVLMDRGFYNGEVYTVLRRYGIKFLTPATKSKGAKGALFEALEVRCINEDIQAVLKKIDVLIDHEFHGRGYKGVSDFKNRLTRHTDALYGVNSISELIVWLKAFRDLEDTVPKKLGGEYGNLRKLADTIVKRITETPRFIVQTFELRGKKRATIILSMQLNEDLLQRGLDKKFKSVATRNEVEGELPDFEDLLKRLFLDSYYFFASSPIKKIPVDKQSEIYKRRWTVETAHKMFHEVLLSTISNDIIVRNMEILVAVATYDLWVIHRKSERQESEHVFNVTLREFKENYVQNEFLLLEYDEGRIAFVRYGEIVDLERFSEGVSSTSDVQGGRYEMNLQSVRLGGEPPPMRMHIYVVVAVCNRGRQNA